MLTGHFSRHLSIAQTLVAPLREVIEALCGEPRIRTKAQVVLCRKLRYICANCLTKI